MEKEIEVKKEKTQIEERMLPEGYVDWRKEIISLIEHSKFHAALSVNAEMLALYWKIGSDIIKKQEEQGWGTQVVEQLSKDLSIRFPDDRGYSARNLWNMKRFAKAYPKYPILQVPLAELDIEDKSLQIFSCSTSSLTNTLCRQGNGWQGLLTVVQRLEYPILVLLVS